MIPREEVALLVRGFLEDERMGFTLSAFNKECKLKLPKKPLEKKLASIVAEHKELCESAEDLDMPQLWRRLDILLGHLRFITMPRSAPSGRSQQFRSKRGNSILHDQRRGVQPFTVTLQHSDSNEQRWQQDTSSSRTTTSATTSSSQAHMALSSSSVSTSYPAGQEGDDKPATPQPLSADMTASASLASFPAMSVGEETSQVSLASDRHESVAVAPAGHGAALKSPRRKSARPQRKRPITESPIKERLAMSTSTNAAGHLVETILSTPSLQSKLAEEINQHHIHSGPSNEQSLFGFTSPINAAASAAGNLTSDTAPNIQVDAHGDDTVARVLEWMHNEPAFEDMPWSELDSSKNHDTGSENLAPVPPSNTTSNALDPFCLTPPKYDTLSPALAGTSPSLADFECSPMHGSLLTSVLDAAAAAAASSGVEMQPESSLASSLTGGNALFVNETSQGNALGYASCGQNGRSSTSTVPSSGPQPSRASCHARSLNFDTAPSKEVTDTLSFVQRNAISVFPPVDAVVTSIPSSTSAAASPSSLLVAANQPLPSLASGDAVSPSQAADGDSVHSSYGPPPKKRKKKKKKKHDELEAFPADVDVEGFLSRLNYD